MNQYISSSSLENKQNTGVSKLRDDCTVSGMQFHLAMQQAGLGIPIDDFMAAYPQLKQWVDAALPYTQIPGNKSWNVDLCHEFNGVYLRENYDFIVSNDNKTVAIDWTIGKVQDMNALNESWKTQLRLFLLHENMGIECENISLIYVKVNTGAVYQCCYSAKQHQENKQELELIITQPNQTEVELMVSTSESDSMAEMHKLWEKGEIDIQEYFNAIPEVKW